MSVSGCGRRLRWTTTLTITNGTASVTTGGGATIGGNGTSTVTLSGTAAQINAALTGLTYTNTPDYNGPAQIMVATNDGTVTTTDTISNHGDAQWRTSPTTTVMTVNAND